MRERETVSMVGGRQVVREGGSVADWVVMMIAMATVVLALKVLGMKEVNDLLCVD